MSDKKAKATTPAAKATVNAVMLNGVDIQPFILIQGKLHKGKLQATVNQLAAKGKTAQQIITALEPMHTGKRTATDIFNCCVDHLAQGKNNHKKGGRNFIGANIAKVTATPAMLKAVLAGAKAVGQRLQSEYSVMLKVKAEKAKATAVKVAKKAAPSKPNPAATGATK